MYQEIFKEVELSKDSNSKSQFTLNQGGSYFAVGVGGAITGRGGDLILCDDVVKNADEARSSTYQNNLREWWGTTLYTRLMKDAAVVLVNTRWSDKDLASWILENDFNGEWEVLCLPAISDDGEALWPERYPLSALEVIKREAGTKNFNSLYQQRPSPEEGNVIKREWLKYYRKLPEKLDKIVISVDTSMQESASADNCAITVLARSRASQIVYLLDFHIAKMGFVSALNNIKKMHSKYPRSTIVIENTANGSALIETLKMTTPNVIGVNPKGSKVSRILNIAPSFEAGQIIFPHRDIKLEVENVIEELVTFPDAKHDDFCDSLSQGVLRLRASGAEMRLNQLIDEYDENGIPFTEKKPETDIRKIFWDHVDWDLEDSM